MVFHARSISFKPTWLNDLPAHLMAGHFEPIYGEVLRRLVAVRSELAAIQKLRDRGIDAVSRDYLASS